MGLDLVELAMGVESEFRLTMTEAEAGLLNTAGDVHSFVCAKVRNRPSECVSQRAFQALRRVLMAAGAERREVTLDLCLDPKGLDWKALETEMGQSLRPLPAASLGSWIRVSLGMARESRTVRELVIALRDQLPGQDWAWTEARVWSRLVKVIAHQFAVSEDLVHRETDFVLDLGAC